MSYTDDTIKTPDIYSPDFIPFTPQMLKLGLNVLEVLVYNFIHFYLSRAGGEAFYFSNKDIAKAVMDGTVSARSIQNAIRKLAKLGLIEVEYKVKAGGGKIRFIRLVGRTEKIFCSERKNSSVQNGKKLPLYINKNKINKNKINNLPTNVGSDLSDQAEGSISNKNKQDLISEGDKTIQNKVDSSSSTSGLDAQNGSESGRISQGSEIESSREQTSDLQAENGEGQATWRRFGNAEVNRVLEMVEDAFGRKLPVKFGRSRSDRWLARNMLQLLTKRGKNGIKEGREWLPDDPFDGLQEFLKHAKRVEDERRITVSYFDTLYDWLHVWLGSRGTELFGVRSSEVKAIQGDRTPSTIELEVQRTREKLRRMEEARRRKAKVKRVEVSEEARKRLEEKREKVRREIGAFLLKQDGFGGKTEQGLDFEELKKLPKDELLRKLESGEVILSAREALTLLDDEAFKKRYGMSKEKVARIYGMI